MNAFDVAFYQIDLGGEAALGPTVLPYACRSSPNVSFQKLENMRGILWVVLCSGGAGGSRLGFAGVILIVPFFGGLASS